MDLEEINHSSYTTHITGEMLGEMDYIDIIPPEEFSLSNVKMDYRNLKNPSNIKVISLQKVPEKYRIGIWGVYAEGDEDANYLMNCEGADNPRYVTKLE